MSLTDDTKLTALAESIATPLSADPSDEEKAARSVAVTDIKRLCQKIMEYVVANGEIKGIKALLDISLNTIFTAGVPAPTDGGLALQTAWKLATAAKAADGSTQSNDGTGRIE